MQMLQIKGMSKMLLPKYLNKSTLFKRALQMLQYEMNNIPSMSSTEET